MALNPYNPTDAVRPPCFAGRKGILGRAAELLEAAQDGIHGGILLSGHRGIGKTSALRAIEAQIGKGAAVARLRFTRKTTLPEFAAELIGTLRAEHRNWRDRFGVSEVELPHVTVRLQPRAQGEATPGVALGVALRALRRVKVLWLSLDDVDWVEGDALSLLKSAMEQAERPTVLVAMAGGPQVRERMVSEHSPIIRFFTGSDFDLGNFSMEETCEALTLPLTSRRIATQWAPDAVASVHRWTGGYPYLIQCLAHAAFQSGSISSARVDWAATHGLRAAGTWMNRELATASDLDIQHLDRIGKTGRNEWSQAELVRLGLDPTYVRRLERLGALHKVRRGRYLVVKPPMIARYHMWKRGLGPREDVRGSPPVANP